MGRRDRERRETLERLGRTGFRSVVVPRAPMLCCGKCGSNFPDYAANEHLLKCQPQGALCGTCKQLIPAAGFIEHYRACKGVKVAEAPKEGTHENMG